LIKPRSRFSCAQQYVYISIVLLGFLTVTGCERGPLDLVCTPMEVGDLVFSELRGNQTGDDTAGQWIEVYNSSASPLNLSGLTLTLMKLDGSSLHEFVVRDQVLDISAGGFVVLGHMDTPGSLPDHMDYEFGDAFPSKLFTDGILEMRSCQATIDWIAYQDLPKTGSLAFDGNLALTFEANDQQENWCVDDTIVLPAEAALGTPGETNRPCE